MDVGFDPMSLLIQEGLNRRFSSVNKFSDLLNQSFNQWMTDIRMRNRVGREAYKEGQKEAWKQQTGLELTNAQKSVMAYNSEEAEKAWERQMDYERNKYSIQTASMEDAGLNPAMVYGGGNLVQTSANGDQASAGMPSAGAGFSDIMDMITKMSMVGSEMSLMKAQARLANQQANAVEYSISKTQEETEGIGLENQWKAETLEDRKEAVSLANDLTREEKRKIEAQCDEIAASIDKLIAETKDAEAAADLKSAQAIYTRWEAYEIAQMLPYKQRLAQAQTWEAQSRAAYTEIQTLIEKDKREGGYYLAMINKMKAETEDAIVRAHMSEIHDALQQGKYYTIDPNDPKVKQAWDKVMNRLFSAITVFNDNLNPIASSVGRLGYVGGAESSSQSQGTTTGAKIVEPM